MRRRKSDPDPELDRGTRDLSALGRILRASSSRVDPTKKWMTDKLAPWSDYVDILKSQGDLLKLTWKPEDEAYRADVYAQLLSNLSYAYIQYFQSNGDHPE